MAVVPLATERPACLLIVDLLPDGRLGLAPDASGVRMRTRRERDPDWLRNLEHEPRCEIQVGSVTVPAVYEPSTDVTADLRRAVELLQAKYGSGWVEDWYVDRGRVPVKLRVE